MGDSTPGSILVGRCTPKETLELAMITLRLPEKTNSGQYLVGNTLGACQYRGLGPVIPVFPRHQITSLREGWLAVGQVPAHVVRMKAGKHHQIDCLAADPFIGRS